jgi:hypothetical protein
MSSIQRWTIACAAAIAFAAPLAAQQKVSSGVAVAPFTSAVWAAAPSTLRTTVPLPVEPTVAPLLAPSLVQRVQSRNVTTAPTAASMSLLLPPPQGQGRDVAMMVVGGVGLVVGSLIDGDTGTIVMAGSGIVGLIGLYRYLR